MKITVRDLWLKARENEEQLLPTNTGLAFWEGSYGVVDEHSNYIFADAYDKAFARMYADFLYDDILEYFLDPDDLLDAFQQDFLNVLVLNQKKYSELYRIFVVTDEDNPLTWNYDMTETFGEQHSQTDFTKGEQENTNGETTDTHKVAPMDSTTPITESQDVTDQHTFTDGERKDTTETTIDEYTNTRRGNLGVMTAVDMLQKQQTFWDAHYKFMQEIFNDVCRNLLHIGECGWHTL